MTDENPRVQGFSEGAVPAAVFGDGYAPRGLYNDDFRVEGGFWVNTEPQGAFAPVVRRTYFDGFYVDKVYPFSFDPSESFSMPPVDLIELYSRYRKSTHESEVESKMRLIYELEREISAEDIAELYERRSEEPDRRNAIHVYEAAVSNLKYGLDCGQEQYYGLTTQRYRSPLWRRVLARLFGVS